MIGFLFRRVIALACSVAAAFAADAAGLSLTNGALGLQLDTEGRCVVSELWVHGRRVSAPEAGARTGIMISNVWFTSGSNQSGLKIKQSRDQITIEGIRLGPEAWKVEEKWTFARAADAADALTWRIERRYPAAAAIQDSAFPAWTFATMGTWTGALLDNGGVAWNRYLDQPGATYGVEANGFVCWNQDSNSALSISLERPRSPGAPLFSQTRFTHERDGSQTAAFSLAPALLKPKHDLRRFLPDAPDVWAPFEVSPGVATGEFRIAAVDYDAVYSLGELRGVKERGVRQMLHTIGRYGVVDRRIVGANGWRSGFKCLHEQWFAQMGIALQDPDYLANCAATFDYERDQALLPDGRLKSRWWWVAGDATPGTYDALGYYEARWGTLMDSQTCFPICVAELFDLTGDRVWLASHKDGCERMLDYLLRLDGDGDGLVEMHNALHSEAKGSDWIDVVWAAHENALINAELYWALGRWSELEELLGDHARAKSFQAAAAKLKASFNRTTDQGGFWDSGNKWYIYWRDKDDSLHGNNLVTPVNFAAIAYGLCDQTDRRDAILDRIETEMQKEKLFYWPLSFFPYEPDEGHPTVNYPFPSYENGDIFLSWGELAVRAFAGTRPGVAMKYIRNTLEQYERDGLSFQRYLRGSQKGAGGDILAGNVMPIVGLYRNIYGAQPKHNRLLLAPRLTPDLDGTRLRYRLRGQTWLLDLATSGCGAAMDDFQLRAPVPFGVNVTNNALQFFPGTEGEPGLVVARSGGKRVEVRVETWTPGRRQWTVTAPLGNVQIAQTVSGLASLKEYQVSSGGRSRRVRADAQGEITIRQTVRASARFEMVEDRSR